MKRTIVILGMHRSGTSMMGAILEKLGVNMGEEKLGASSSNPLGHFEDVNFVNINNRILEDAGGSWDKPPEEESISNLEIKYREDIKRILDEKYKAYDIWGWKDPRTSLTIKLYHPFLENVKYIYCLRDENEVANSLSKRDKMPIEDGINLKKIYDKRIEEFLKNIDKNSYKTFYYEDIVKNPEKNIEDLINFLGLKVTKQQKQEALKLILPKEKLEEMKKVKKSEERKKLIIKGITKPWKIPNYLYKKIMQSRKI